MKTKLLCILTIMLSVSVELKAQERLNQPIVKLTTFKNVPNEMIGFGNTYYLSIKDQKRDKMICVDDMTEILIHLNGVPLKLKNLDEWNSKQRVYTNKDYKMIIKITYQKTTGDESYSLRAHMTFKKANKVLWEQNVVGEGGA